MSMSEIMKGSKSTPTYTNNWSDTQSGVKEAATKTTTTTTSTPTYTDNWYTPSGAKEAAESIIPTSNDSKLVANLGTDYNSFEKNSFFMTGAKMMMEFENTPLKKEVEKCIEKKDWSGYNKIGLSVYSDLGVTAFGFGCRQPHPRVDAHVANMKSRTFKTTTQVPESEYKPYITQKLTEMYSEPGKCKTKWEPISVILPYARDGKNISTSLKVAYMTALWTFMDRAMGMIDIFLKEPAYGPAYDPLVMNVWELAALTDFAYNIRWGNQTWYPGSDNGDTLRNAVIAHQTAKKAKADATTIKNALNAVGGAFMTYTGAEGKSNKGLARRRAAEFDMYKGDPVNYSRTDAEVATLTTSLGVKPEDIVMIGTDDSARIEAAESVWRTVMGNASYSDNPEILKALQTGSVEEFIKAVQAYAASQSEIKKKAAKALADNDNVEKTAATELEIKTETINLYPIADGRSMSGMSIHTTTMHGSAEENARSRKNLTQQIGAFKKYGQVNDEDLGQAKSTLFFVTRPEMCLYQNTTDKKDSSTNFFEPSLQMRDPDLIDHLKIDRDLYIMLDRHIKPDFTETNIAFIPAFTNQFRSATPPEVNFDFDKSAANIHGVGLSLPVYNSSDSADSSIPVTFNVDNNMSVMKYIDLIFKYAKSKKEGLTLPWKNVVKYNVIDFSMTLFMFTVGQDGVTLESWERSVGVIPSNNPLSSIPKNSQQEKMESVNINFKTNTNLDSRKLSIIHHFNFLNRIGCASDAFKLTKKVGEVGSYDEAIDWYMTNYNTIETWVQDNMEYEDWYCERYQIFLDTDGVHHSYKIVGIPTWKRLQYILNKFVKDTRLRTLLAVDETAKGQPLRFSKSSEYIRYGLNMAAFNTNIAFANESKIGAYYKNTISNLDKTTDTVMTKNKESTTDKSFSDGFGLGHKQFKTVDASWLERENAVTTLQDTQDWSDVLKPESKLDKKYKGVSDFTMTADDKNNYNVTADGTTFKFDKFKYDLFIAPRKSTTYFSNNTMFNEKTGLFIMKDTEEIYTHGIMDASNLTVEYTADFVYDKKTTVTRIQTLNSQYSKLIPDEDNVFNGYFINQYLEYMAKKYEEKYGVPLVGDAISNPSGWRLDIVPTEKLYVKDSRVGGSAPYIKDGKAYRKQVKIVKDEKAKLTSDIVREFAGSSQYLEGLGQESPSMLGNGLLGSEIIDVLDQFYYIPNYTERSGKDSNGKDFEIIDNKVGYFYTQLYLYLTDRKTNQFQRYISETSSKIDMEYTMMDVAGINRDMTSRDNVVYNSGGVSYTNGGMVVKYMDKNTMFGDDYVKQLEETEKDKSENASLNRNTHDKQKQLLSHFEEKNIPIFPDSEVDIRIGKWGFNIGAMANSLIDTAKASLANWAANNLSALVTKKLTELVVGKNNLNKDKHDNSKFRMSDKDLALVAKLKRYESLSVDTKNAESVSYTEYQEPELTDNEDLPSEEYIEKPVESDTKFSKIEPLVAEEKYTPIQFVDTYTYKDDNNSSFKLDIDDKTLKAINSLLKKRNVNDFDEEYNDMLSSTEKSLAKLEGSVKYIDMFKLVGDNLISLELEAISKERFDIETDTDVDDIKYKESLEKLANLENMKIVRDNPIPEEDFSVVTDHPDFKERFDTFLNKLYNMEKMSMVRDNPIPAENPLVEKRNEDIVMTEKSISDATNILSSNTGSKISTLNKTASDNMLGVYTRVTDMLSNNTMYDMYVDNKKVFDDAMTMYTRSTTGNINKISGSTTDVSDIILAALE